MTIYTVTSEDDHPKLGTSRYTIGSFTTRGRALDECVDYIMKRLRVRNDLAFCMANDENHPEAKEFFSGCSGRSDNWHVKRGKAKALRALLRDALGGDGRYYACLDAGMGGISFHFDVDENVLEGPLWTTVTWGDSDTEDPEFTTPCPETFVSEDDAIENFYRYALDLKKEHGVEVSEGFKGFVYAELREDGRCQVDLEDGCCVSCVLYSTPMGDVR